MPAVLTIGYTQKSLERFVRLLLEANVDALIDIRLRNTSQLAGFAKRDDLAFLLRAGFGIAYEHRLDLAPHAGSLDAYRRNADWDAYEHSYESTLAERQAEAAGRRLLELYRRPCLLCAEHRPDRCHRRLLAEWWQQRIADLEIVHLM